MSETVTIDPAGSTGLLGDTAARDYARRLSLFNRFAAAELQQAIDLLDLQPGMRVLDAGCGSGEALAWLAERVGPGGQVVGVDLAHAHVSAARRFAAANVQLLQGDLARLPLPADSFDRIWCANTLHHLHDPQAGLQALIRLLRPGGRIALGQSSFMPDMVFAWDSRLERLTNEAVRRYYRERYGVDERRLADVRAIVGLLRRAGLVDVGAKTCAIERVSPLAPADRDYLLEAQFRGAWGLGGERLRPYLDDADFAALCRLCDPREPGFALDRPDFHFIQTFSVAIGGVTPQLDG